MSSDLSFDYGQGKQKQVEKNLVKGTSKEQTASIPACVTDSLSAIFYAATQPMVVGQSVRFPLADSMRTVTVAMKIEGKEEIKTPAGTFQTIKAEPTADEGIVKNRGRIWVWYTDDARHMPVQIQARLSGDDYVPPAVVRDKVRRNERILMTDFVADPDKFVTVGKFLEPVNAQMAKGMLESAGIECFLQGENANSLLALAFRARLLVHSRMKRRRGRFWVRRLAS